MNGQGETGHRNSLGSSLLKGFPLLGPLALLAASWLVPRLVASSMVPPGFEYQAWTPLRDDLQALSLDPARVRVELRSTLTGYHPDKTPLHARYVLWSRNVAYLHHLNVSNAWQPWGVPERPPRDRSFRRSRLGKADNCPQELANAMPRGRAIESAVLTWREQTPRGGQQATLTVWRAVRASGGPRDLRRVVAHAPRPVGDHALTARKGQTTERDDGTPVHVAPFPSPRLSPRTPRP